MRTLPYSYTRPEAGQIRASRNRAPLVEDPLACRFADLLSAMGIEYEYEPHVFFFSNRTKKKNSSTPRQCQPDFYLPEFKTHVEISCNIGSSRKQKMRKLLIDIFPDHPVAFVSHKEIEILEQRNAAKLLTWEMLLVMCMDKTGNSAKNRFVLRRWDTNGTEHLDYPHPAVFRA